ncbi:hypothetical protein FI667_g16254, partial [Globisporangium splendens]
MYEAHPERNSHFVGAEPQNGSDETWQERRVSWSEQTFVRLGRRNVQQMSTQEWREALEQQIREEKEHELQQKEARDGMNSVRRTSQSAPSAQDQAHTFPEKPQLESGKRVVTTSGSMPGGAGRKRVGMQTHEEHLKQMQEQLELKKVKFEQDALEYKKMLCQQRRRSLEEDDAQPLQCSTENPSNVVAVEPMVSSLGSRQNNHAQENQAPEESISSPPEQKSSTEDSTAGNQFGPESSDNFEAKDSADTPGIANSMRPSAPVVVADPIALAKVVDFCEELKRQNEDVKKQLVEQHSVLASLKSSLIVAPETKKKRAAAKPLSSTPASHPTAATVEKSHGVASPIPFLRQRSSLPREMKAVDAKQRDLQLETRPQKGESKIPFPSNANAVVAGEQGTAPVPTAAMPIFMAQSKDDLNDQLQDKLTMPLPQPSHAPAANKVVDDNEELACEEKEAKAELDSKDAEDANDELAERHCRTDSKNDDDDECTNDSRKKHGLEHHTVEFDSDHESTDEEEELQILHTSAHLERVDSAKLVYSSWEEDDVPLGGESKFLHCDAKSVDNDNDDEEDTFEAKGEMKSCNSSFILLDGGSSSLVPVDKSLDSLFIPECQ